MKTEIKNEIWQVITRTDGTLWVQGPADEHGWREVCSLPIFMTRDRARCEVIANEIARLPQTLATLAALHDALLAALPFVTDQSESEDFKPGYVAGREKQIRAAIALVS